MLKALASEISSNRSFQKALSIQCRRALSAQPQPQEKFDRFRTAETDPAKHSLSNVGQYYTIPPDVYKQVFAYGGVPKTYQQQLDTFNENCLMVRQPGVELINACKNLDITKPVVRFVMYGPKGCGKSLVLAHVLHYCYQEGFLLVHVPWVGNWMRRPKDYGNSDTREGYIDLNLDAAAWLVHFKHQNSHLLSNPALRTSQEYVWNKRESTPKDAPLLELVDHGTNRLKFASEVIRVLAEELKQLSMAGLCKTLVAIDGYNALFYPKTRIITDKKEIVHPSKVTFTEAFLNLTRFDWNNGIVVLIVDELCVAEKDQISYLPRYLLGKDGFDHLDPFVPIQVKNYSEREIISCLDYFRERRWIPDDPQLNEELPFLSANNPYRLMELTAGI